MNALRMRPYDEAATPRIRRIALESLTTPTKVERTRKVLCETCFRTGKL
jgi:hypothetical protein